MSSRPLEHLGSSEDGGLLRIGGGLGGKAVLQGSAGAHGLAQPALRRPPRRLLHLRRPDPPCRPQQHMTIELS